MTSFTRAIVRPPGKSFASGITTGAGGPSLELALEQHAEYCRALAECGLEVVALGADDEHPDATFVEDTAIIVEGQAILTRPGAPSRQEEVDAIRDALAPIFPTLAAIEAPGTVDGGDVCEGLGCVFIGLSQRTNAEGAAQLSAWLTQAGFFNKTIDISDTELLHLKSGMAHLGQGRYVLVDSLRNRLELEAAITVDLEEAYAANCVRVNDSVLVASGYPSFERTLRDLGYTVVALDMSEFQKMDGGLSCLSLRF
ncbi:MAG: N(G),N(G)-dimethylarginine dimethylaminohydrolase [Candidatus Eremiobacteraeota bacterium]|nr:N(G),N(G)-dimethylarginine dimethylaminohydrolase [Candidatus Eremiobacteraeota bacterium]